MKTIKKIILLFAVILLFLSGIACNTDMIGETAEEEKESDTVNIEKEIEFFDNTLSPMSERIGIANWGAMYMPDLDDNETSLIRGAKYVRDTGSKVIKIACGDPDKQYPLDNFSDLFMSGCVDALKYSSYKRLFEMDFSVFFISITEVARVKFADGITDAEAEIVKNEFYEATKYLLETYRGTGKTFILQNWETDNYLNYSVSGDNAQFVYRNYAKYFNARQDGINKARSEFVMSKEKNVYVFGALEINKLSDSYTGIRAVDYVVPYTYADLYTYSSYEFKDKGVITSASDVAEKLETALEYYNSKLPNKNVYPQKMYFGDNRLAITEFGYPDKADNYSGEWQKTVAEGHILAVKNLKLQYAVYWQTCCNELVSENASAIKKLSSTDLRAYRFINADFNGFYIIRPDGEKTLTYRYFKELFSQ